MSDQQPEQRRISIQLDPETEAGNYSNFLTIMHSETEFVMDFGLFVPGKNAIKVLDRIIAHPRHAKQFLIALQDNVDKYESVFGEIDTNRPNPPSSGVSKMDH